MVKTLVVVDVAVTVTVEVLCSFSTYCAVTNGPSIPCSRGDSRLEVRHAVRSAMPCGVRRALNSTKLDQC